MVPGMFERERLAADAQRLEWLAEASIGSARLTTPLHQDRAGSGQHAASAIDLWRRGLALSVVLGRRMRLVPRGSADLRPQRVEPTGA